MAEVDWFARVLATPAVQALARRAGQGGVCPCSGVSPAAHAFVAVLLQRLRPGRPVVVVTEGVREQELLQQEMGTWLAYLRGGDATKAAAVPPEVQFFAGWDVLPHEARLPHADSISDRLAALLALAAPGTPPAEAPLIVTTAPALMQRTFRPETLAARSRQVSRGDRLDPLDWAEWLEEQGYESEIQVNRKGEVALRGGVLDFYPPTSPWPVRLDFFGDEIESIRYFDPISQLSREEIPGVRVSPAGELGVLRKEPGEGTATLMDYLPPGAVLLLAEPAILRARADDYAAQIPAADPFFCDWSSVIQAARVRGAWVVEVSLLGEASPDADAGGREAPAPIEWGLEGLEAYRPLAERAPDLQVAEARRREFFTQIHRWMRQGVEVCVFCNNQGERDRFLEVWHAVGGEGTADAAAGETPPGAPPVAVNLGTLARGFLCEVAGVVVVTDAEIFGRYKVQRPRRLKAVHAQATRSALDIDFTELEEGDYVVHLQHGIGRYAGLRFLPEGAGAKPLEHAGPDVAGQECLAIEFASGDPAQPAPVLYVPVTEAHLVSKYVGVGKARPSLNTLGGTRWAKSKAQAEEAVRDVAGELLAIQAARQSQAGHAFGPDTPWQREFEGAFVFEETPDQARAISETKADMEQAKPMDRLICGDVGFGKTEVAIRAAFKAVMGGKQAAILVPTTVLAQQHYNQFRERMADYPVRVELLSRFRSRRAQAEVVRDLAAGSVDIVVGTHRLVQNDIGFKNLGLVVIDEEQRFGVLHKEKFKRLRRMVDVLTLSATPIPRTLYLALAGARDMSTIQTPPQDRLPVETVVTAYDERVIRDAIQREMNREGQVFFLHNRVGTIQAMAVKLAELVPKARILVGHGQMHADDLEEVMTRFVNGEADILLSTTIIESGLDIPNANTIIIDRADRFGLSELYQLRGRVGRYKHQAHAYLLLPRHARLLTDVRKRMSAIKQYSTLGSGFKIALRDLEIRGAGNLLGAEQSGHITAVGFDLYCQLLKQSVASLRGETVRPRVEVRMSLDFLSLGPGDSPGETLPIPLLPPEEGEDPPEEKPRARGTAPAAAGVATAGIPFRYISDPRQRIEIYRKLAQATAVAELAELRKGLRDRFGRPPRPLELLLETGELKVLAAERGVTGIEVRENKLMLTKDGDYLMLSGRFPRLSKPSAAGRLKEIRTLLLSLQIISFQTPGIAENGGAAPPPARRG